MNRVAYDFARTKGKSREDSFRFQAYVDGYRDGRGIWHWRLPSLARLFARWDAR